MRRQIDNSTLEMALVGYRAQHAEITGKMAEIRKRLGTAAPSGGGGGATATGKRKPLSAAGGVAWLTTCCRQAQGRRIAGSLPGVKAL